MMVNFRGPTGGKEMNLVSSNEKGDPVCVFLLIYTLTWGPSVVGWEVPRRFPRQLQLPSHTMQHNADVHVVG